MRATQLMSAVADKLNRLKFQFMSRSGHPLAGINDYRNSNLFLHYLKVKKNPKNLPIHKQAINSYKKLIKKALREGY